MIKLTETYNLKTNIFPFRKNDNGTNVLTLIPQTTEQFEDEEWKNKAQELANQYVEKTGALINFKVNIY